MWSISYLKNTAEFHNNFWSCYRHRNEKIHVDREAGMREIGHSRLGTGARWAHRHIGHRATLDTWWVGHARVRHTHLGHSTIGHKPSRAHGRWGTVFLGTATVGLTSFWAREFGHRSRSARGIEHRWFGAQPRLGTVHFGHILFGWRIIGHRDRTIDHGPFGAQQ